MYNITDTDKEFQSLLSSQLEGLDASFEKNFFTQEATLELLSLGVNLSNSLKFESSKVIWNVACFINIISYDLKVIARSLLHSKREWEKRLFARQASTLIYESINDLFELLGADLKKAIQKLPDIEIIETALKEVRSDLNLYKGNYFAFLKEIRNVSSAHRDKDAIKQLKIIYSISWSESFNTISGFDQILNKLGPILQHLTGKVRELENLK